MFDNLKDRIIAWSIKHDRVLALATLWATVFVLGLIASMLAPWWSVATFIKWFAVLTVLIVVVLILMRVHHRSAQQPPAKQKPTTQPAQPPPARPMEETAELPAIGAPLQQGFFAETQPATTNWAYLLSGFIAGLGILVDVVFWRLISWPHRSGTHWLASLFSFISQYQIVGMVICAIPIIAWSVYNCQMTLKDIARREPDERHLAIPVRQGKRLIRLNAAQLRHVVRQMTIDEYDPGSSDHEIRVATRKHWMSPVLNTIAPIRIKIVLDNEGKKTKKAYRVWGPSLKWVAAFLAAWLILTLDAIAPHLPVISTGVAVICSLMVGYLLIKLAATAFACWLDWLSWYLVITDQRIHVIVQYPSWLWWRDGRAPQVYRSRITLCEQLDQDNWISKYFEIPWGVVNVDTIIEFDPDFNDMTSIPWFEEVTQLIQGMIIQDKSSDKEAIASLTQSLHEARATIIDLTEVMRTRGQQDRPGHQPDKGPAANGSSG